MHKIQHEEHHEHVSQTPSLCPPRSRLRCGRAAPLPTPCGKACSLTSKSIWELFLAMSIPTVWFLTQQQSLGQNSYASKVLNQVHLNEHRQKSNIISQTSAGRSSEDRMCMQHLISATEVQANRYPEGGKKKKKGGGKL